MHFFKAYIQTLLTEGHKVEIACNEYEFSVDDWYRQNQVPIHSLSCSRSPFSLGNIKAIREIKKLVAEKRYDIVHCHTPIAAACTRLACRKARKSGVKVIYTAHGFHFYQGAPFLNWALFYPVEKLCAHWTDLLITINREDFERSRHFFRAKQTAYVPGVGIKTQFFADAPFDRAEKLEAVQIPIDAVVCFSVGELNANKNHKTVIQAIAICNDAKLHYVIAGEGECKEELEQLATELGVASQVHFLGYRTDVAEWYRAADIYIHPSYREGLPVSVMEAMAAGLPCVVSNIRGNVDLIVPEQGGYLCRPAEHEEFASAIMRLQGDWHLRSRMGEWNAKRALQYDVEAVNTKMKTLYRQTLQEEKPHEDFASSKQ